METLYVTVPVWKCLASESAWSHDQGRRVFSVVRWHLVLRKHQLDDPAAVGHRIGGFHGKGIEFTYKKGIEELDLKKSISQSVMVNETLRALTDQITAGIGAKGLAKVAMTTKAEVTSRIRAEFAESFEFTVSTKRVEEVGSTMPKLNKPMAIVQRFLRYRTTVYLGYVDYLVVEYRAAPMAIRVKRRKYPAPMENVLKFNVPILGLEHWGVYPGIAWINEDEYARQVEDPYAIEFFDPASEPIGHVAFPAQPSLHRIANAAFPLKWSKRSGPWTEAELKAIEEVEYSDRMERRFNWPRFGARGRGGTRRTA